MTNHNQQPDSPDEHGSQRMRVAPTAAKLAGAMLLATSCTPSHHSAVPKPAPSESPAVIRQPACPQDIDAFEAVNAAQSNPRTERAFKILDKRLHGAPNVAAAVVGVAMHESNLDPKMKQYGGIGQGILMWQGYTWNKQVESAQHNDADPRTLASQLNFVADELEDKYPDILTQMEDAPNAYRAAGVFNDGYIRPAEYICDETSKEYAEAVDTLYNSDRPVR
jgi:hypothetical protein